MSYSFVYLLTNTHKTVLYCGVTSGLQKRVYQHAHSLHGSDAFTTRYNCIFLVYCEAYSYIMQAIEREKQIKGYSRKKKNELVETLNPSWHFLSDVNGNISDQLMNYCKVVG